MSPKRVLKPLGGFFEIFWHSTANFFGFSGPAKKTVSKALGKFFGKNWRHQHLFMPRLILNKMQKKRPIYKTLPAGSAQGALEYLLLLGGAILVAVIVIALILNIGGSSEEETYLAAAHAMCAKYPQNECSSQVVSVKGRSYLCLPLVQSQCRAAKGLIAYYKMNDNVAGAGQQILDSSGKENTGTIIDADCTIAGQNGGDARRISPTASIYPLSFLICSSM